MDRVSLSSGIGSVIRPALQEKFCICFSLNTGIRVISVLAIVFGVWFMILGTELDNNGHLAYFIATCCAITAVTFFSWFLNLLLLQSLDMKLPRKLAVWIGSVLAVWLVFLSVCFTISLFVFWNENDFERGLAIIVIVLCLFGGPVVLYGVCVLMNYIQFLERQAHGIDGSPNPQVQPPSHHFSPTASQISQTNSISSQSNLKSLLAKTNWLYNTRETSVQEQESSFDEENTKPIEPLNSRVNLQTIFVKGNDPDSLEKKFGSCPSALHCKSQQTTPTRSKWDLHQVRSVTSSGERSHQERYVNECDFISKKSEEDGFTVPTSPSIADHKRVYSHSE